MDIQVGELDGLERRVDAALDRIGELQAGTRVNTESFFPESFMRDHTEYDSFDAFREDGPWSPASADQVEAVPTEELDEYVAATTEFESWESMKNQAAEEEIVAELVRNG